MKASILWKECMLTALKRAAGDPWRGCGNRSAVRVKPAFVCKKATSAQRRPKQGPRKRLAAHPGPTSRQGLKARAGRLPRRALRKSRSVSFESTSIGNRAQEQFRGREKAAAPAEKAPSTMPGTALRMAVARPVGLFRFGLSGARPAGGLRRPFALRSGDFSVKHALMVLAVEKFGGIGLDSLVVHHEHVHLAGHD